MTEQSGFLPGMHCMCYHPAHAWVRGVIDSFDGRHVSVSTLTPVKEQVSKLLSEDVFVCDEHAMAEDVDDLLKLSVLHEGTLLNCLYSRYFRDVVYTNIGAIVVALNPFNFNIPWYMDSKMPDYLAEGETIQHNMPHSWAVAHSTYYEMRRDGQNQSIIVSGESGAGKTEAAKIVMKYLAALSALQGTEQEKKTGSFVGERMIQSNPILEAFGNAKTVRNDNSSRFGKLMRIKFNRNGLLTGADVTKYLLEKSRIVTSGLNERVYHAFYLLLRGRDRERYGLEALPQYRNVMAGKAPDIEGVDDAADYDDVNTAMGICGFSQEKVESVWRCVGAVLSLLNVEFIATGPDTCEIDPRTERYIADGCRLLSIPAEKLKEELTTTTLTLREGPVVTRLTKAKAEDASSSFCKALYNNLFDFLVTAINQTMDTEDYTTWVALLDIFGFEDFKVNSFEQLCINLTNETLQRHYNYFIFSRDMDECREEGIDVTEVTFPDNTACVELISGKAGILAILDEDCLLAKATDNSFLDKITERFAGKSPFFGRPRLARVPCFRIAHYAGTVTYEVDGFIEKSRDTLKDAFKVLLNESTDSLIKTLLPMPNPDCKSRYTVGGFFRIQLKDLMAVIHSTNPHWIRCIKPHPAKKPLHFDGVQTLTQLRSSGVLGTVQIRKAGYPIRIPIVAFAKKYKVLVLSEALDFGDAVGVTRAVLKAAGFDLRNAQIGKSRIFLKSEAYQQLEVVKKQKLQVFARVAVSGALVSLARMRTAALVRHRSAEIVQGFLRQRSGQQFYREKEYASHKEKVIADVLQLLKLQQLESEARSAFMAERERFYNGITAKRNRLVEDLYEQWLTEKPIRDAVALESLIAAEACARKGLQSVAVTELRHTLVFFEDDYDNASKREEERLAAVRAEEAAAQREAQRREAAIARAEAERRKEEERRLAIALWDKRKQEVEQRVARREAELRRLHEGVCDATKSLSISLALKRQEPVLQARQRAEYPAPPFRPCGVGSLRYPSIGPGELRDGFAASPLGGEYSGAQKTPNRSRSRHGGVRNSNHCTHLDPMREALQFGKECVCPGNAGSLDMVRRLRHLQSVGDKLLVSKTGELGGSLNPYSANWRAPIDGVVKLPDGSFCRLADSAAMGDTSNTHCERRNGSGGRGRYVSHSTMDFDP
ncbi:putative myosin heavy chain [Trypanosoma conorhini]|uniref:Putative myosin heavy chain n=1 Tax=Trypanosoma conorhini TaxID=83891 RepID=A0A3R7LST2_9TRYP|nr:putative myosin heavy chain [Trypanosoma conorhini]RNF19964.1 putative myosin heavy chain [Trypanosoma conorhini]